MLDETLLNKEKKYIVGVSGGCDSMALFNMLRKKNYKIVVCHVNYHVREDSNLDQQLVQEYCQKYHIPLYIKEIQQSEYREDNFEMQAREMRYRFYYDIGCQIKCDGVILGHHMGDVLETIIMQQKRGHRGYLGIQPESDVQNMTIIRPLLNIEKSQLLSYCQKYQVPYRDDYTNFLTDYTRNRIRHTVLAKYSLEDKQNLLQQAYQHNQLLSKKEQLLLPFYTLYDNEQKLNLRKIPQDYLEDIVYYMLKEVVYPPLISQQLIKEIIKQIQSSKPNIQVSLPVNALFIKEYDNIYALKSKESQSYCINYDHIVYDKHEYYYLSETGHLNEGVYVKQSDFPLTIRTYQSGDKIETSSGTKKVSRLFIDKKIPVRQRERWPIVQNGQGKIILIPHIAKNIAYLYTKPNIFVVKL